MRTSGQHPHSKDRIERSDRDIRGVKAEGILSTSPHFYSTLPAWNRIEEKVSIRIEELVPTQSQLVTRWKYAQLASSQHFPDGSWRTNTSSVWWRCAVRLYRSLRDDS